MPTAPIKLDTSCTKIFDISGGSCVGHGLSTINYNLTSLDVATCNLSYSGSNYWNDWHTTVASSSGNWQSIYTTVANLSSDWESARTTVNTLSSYWLSPITLVYPAALEDIDGADETTIENWVDTNFPKASYNKGQKFYVYAFEWVELNNYRRETIDFVFTPDDATISLKCRADCIACNPHHGNHSNIMENCPDECDYDAGKRESKYLRCGVDPADDGGGGSEHNEPDNAWWTCETITQSQNVGFTWDDNYTRRVYGIEMQINDSGNWVKNGTINVVGDCI